MSRFDAVFTAALTARQAEGRARALRPVSPAGPGRVSTPDGALINFSSNDYLGLANHPALAARAADYAAAWGTGAGASRLICGTLPPHQAIEARIAALKGKPAALLMGTGWQANAGVLAALLRLAGNGPGAGPELFSDALNHNSLIAGARLAGVRPRIFRHNDLAHLAELLAVPPTGRRFIVTESVFSMDGDRADLAGLAALADEHDAFLYVDEAHATGVLGEGGRGLCAGIPGIDLVMGTFSKALGSFGAYVAASRPTIDALINFAPGFIYTTALPPPVLGAIDAALDLLPGLDAARDALAARAAGLRDVLHGLGIGTAGSSTQIVPAVVGSEAAALGLAARLREAGLLAVAIRPPTVPEGTSRLRLALSAAHDDRDLAELAGALRAAWPALRRAA